MEPSMIRALIVFALFALTHLDALAQTTLHYREGERVQPEDVRQILENVDTAGGTTRSIRILGENSSAAAAAAAVGAPPPTALSLPVQFEFDSATIQASAKSQLDALAEGIKLLPPGRQVVIEGHTDAVGSDAYNQQLSQRRAAAVKQYLVAHGIEARRLRDVGVGKHQPIKESDPFAAENRRVQFRGG
jgi:OmpA-OmpF porin, OOP family